LWQNVNTSNQGRYQYLTAILFCEASEYILIGKCRLSRKAGGKRKGNLLR
jgi:hypothetical protein